MNNVGRPRIFKTPEDLYKKFLEYKKYAKENKIEIAIPNHKTGSSTIIEQEPPLTWSGFESYLFEKDICKDAHHYRENTDGRYEEFRGIIRAIGEIMYTDKFNGAAVNKYNANIIARDLGLADKKEIKGHQEVKFKGFEFLPTSDKMKPDADKSEQ